MITNEMNAEFLLAAEQGNVKALNEYLSLGVDVNTHDRHGNTAIILASQHHQYDCVARLIAAGADINKQNQICINPFLLSCLNNNVTLLRLLLPAKPDLNRLTRFGGVGLTPACEKGHLPVVKILLEETDININHTNFVGWTPLLEAIVLNDGGATQQAIVALLLEHGASPHMTDKYGKTPLALAREKGFNEIAQLLNDAGA